MERSKSMGVKEIMPLTKVGGIKRVALGGNRHSIVVRCTDSNFLWTTGRPGQYARRDGSWRRKENYSGFSRWFIQSDPGAAPPDGEKHNDTV